MIHFIVLTSIPPGKPELLAGATQMIKLMLPALRDLTLRTNGTSGTA